MSKTVDTAKLDKLAQRYLLLWLQSQAQLAGTRWEIPSQAEISHLFEAPSDPDSTSAANLQWFEPILFASEITKGASLITAAGSEHFRWANDTKQQANRLAAQLSNYGQQLLLATSLLQGSRLLRRCLYESGRLEKAANQCTTIARGIMWENDFVRLRQAGIEHNSNPTILLVGSPFLPASLFDLSNNCSLLTSLAERGYHAVLLEWKTNNPEQLTSKEYFTLQSSDLTALTYRGLLPALEFLKVSSTAPITVFGHDIAGYMAAHLRAGQPELIAKLAVCGLPSPNATALPILLQISAPYFDQNTSLIDAIFGSVPRPIWDSTFAADDIASKILFMSQLRNFETDSATFKNIGALHHALHQPRLISLPACNQLISESHASATKEDRQRQNPIICATATAQIDHILSLYGSDAEDLRQDSYLFSYPSDANCKLNSPPHILSFSNIFNILSYIRQIQA